MSDIGGIRWERVGQVVAGQGSPSFLEVLVLLDPGVEIRPGEYCMAEIDHGFYGILRVRNAIEVNPYENPSHAHLRRIINIPHMSPGTNLPRRYVVAYTEPVGELRIEGPDNVTYGPPQKLIPAGCVVYKMSGSVLAKVLGYSVPDDRALHIGYLYGTNEPVKLNAFEVLPRHILIVGTTGSGKTYLLGVIVEEICKLKLFSVVNIDFHGDFIKAAGELNGINLRAGKELTVRFRYLEEPELLSILPYMHELHRDIVLEAFRELKEADRDFSIDDLLRKMDEVGRRLGASDHSIHLAKTRVASLKRSRIIGRGIDWEKMLEPGKFVNIDCRGLTHSELQVLVGALSRELLALRRESVIPPIVFAVDEAHLFIPRKEEGAGVQVLREAILFGRHYLFCLILVTQSPMDIDGRIIRITNTRFIFALEPDQLAAIKGVFADAPKEFIDMIPKLERGVCLITGSRETVRHAHFVKVRERHTTHGGATPDVKAVVNRWLERRRAHSPYEGEATGKLSGMHGENKDDKRRYRYGIERFLR